MIEGKEESEVRHYGFIKAADTKKTKQNSYAMHAASSLVIVASTLLLVRK